MMPANRTHPTSTTLPCLEEPNINSHEFQLGYRDAYTHQDQRSQHPEYLAGYLYGARDRVAYRDC
jgi:hypothetical protein